MVFGWDDAIIAAGAQYAPQIGQALLPSLLGGMFAPKDNTQNYIDEYMQKMKALKPDLTYAMQDPAVQALERSGINAGQMAQQRALQQLMAQGFKGSTLTPQISQQAGIQARIPYETNKANMISEVANRNYQQQVDALKMMLQAKTGLSQQQNQYQSTMGLQNMKGLYDLMSKFGTTHS